MISDEELKKELVAEKRRFVHRRLNKDGSESIIPLFRVSPEDVDRYHKMELKDLIDAYVSIYWILYICGQSSVSDLQDLSLVEREIYGFRDRAAQIECENAIKEVSDRHKNAVDKCRKMKLGDLFDTYIKQYSRSDSCIDWDLVLAITDEIYHSRSEEDKKEFRKIQENMKDVRKIV